MPRLLEPTSTVAVILGAYDWTGAGLPRAPSFRRSAAQCHRYLTTPPPHGLGLQPDLVLDLFDDPQPASAQLVRLRDAVRSFIREGKEAARPITDVFIYYIGHGSCQDGQHLYLLVRTSAEGMEEQSSISASALAQALRVAAPQQRRLVVLDCCFSEAAAAAFGGMGTLDDAVAATALRDLEPGTPPPERGTLLLCSSPRTRTSVGPPNAERTLFTGTLLTVLQEGSASRPFEMLSFTDLRDDIYDRMLRDHDAGEVPRPALHQPDQQTGDLTRLPAFPNVAAWARRKAEEERRAVEAERKLEEEQQAAEARRKAEEERRAAEARRKAEEEQRAAEARRKAEEEQRAGEARRKPENEQRPAVPQPKADADEPTAATPLQFQLTQRNTTPKRSLGKSLFLLVLAIVAYGVLSNISSCAPFRNGYGCYLSIKGFDFFYIWGSIPLPHSH
jgi:hypothetical protein